MCHFVSVLVLPTISDIGVPPLADRLRRVRIHLRLERERAAGRGRELHIHRLSGQCLGIPCTAQAPEESIFFLPESSPNNMIMVF